MTSKLVTASTNSTSIAENVLASWQAQVKNALSARKNEATEPEILRLTKILIRLQATAESAITQTHNVTGKKSSSFIKTLIVLSHG